MPDHYFPLVCSQLSQLSLAVESLSRFSWFVMSNLTVVVLAAVIFANVSAQTGSGTINTGSPSCSFGHCNSGETGCDAGGGECSCCPYPKADCCENLRSCCPHGYKCDIQHGQCVQKKGTFVNNFFMPKTLPLGKM